MEHKTACITATLLVALIALLIGLAALGLGIANTVGSMQDLRIQNEEFSIQLNATTSPQAEAIANMQSQINDLIDRINTPVNLYENCTQDAANCTIQIDSVEVVYRRSCLTGRLPMSVEVSLSH